MSGHIGVRASPGGGGAASENSLAPDIFLPRDANGGVIEEEEGFYVGAAGRTGKKNAMMSILRNPVPIKKVKKKALPFDIIVEKYGYDEKQAIRAFPESETYRMLIDPELEICTLSPVAVFDKWECERVTGDPRSSQYIGEG